MEYSAKTGCFKHNSSISTSLKHRQIRDYLHKGLILVVKEMKGASFGKP
jgi:hypothetical protein